MKKIIVVDFPDESMEDYLSQKLRIYGLKFEIMNKEEFTPYGDDWKKQMMKLSKSELIEMLRKEWEPKAERLKLKQ